MMWALLLLNGAAPVPDQEPAPLEHWLLALVLLAVAGVFAVCAVLAAGSEQKLREELAREEARRIWQEVLQEMVGEVQRESLIDQAGRKPWQ